MSKIFNIGDTVAVIDATIKGIVHQVDGKTILLKDSDGFIHQYNKSELVLIKGEQKDFSKYIDIQHDLLLEKEDFKHKKTVKKFKTQRKQPPLEVDLHIHQLTVSTKGMTNYDMLNLQLDTAKRRLEFARNKKIQRIVFIHGVGEGVLELELKNMLKNYPVEVYAASFQKYGFGATEVYLYQNPI